ncbi:MAG: fimbrillin family protein [Prevotella sp.]|nr:fimbrillin family protein [Prevotella sp.]
MKKYIYLAVALGCLTACSNDDTPQDTLIAEGETLPLQLTATVDDMGVTRAGTALQTSAVAKGNMVGVYVLDYKDDNTEGDNPYRTTYNTSKANLMLEAQSNGSLTSTTTYYWPADGNKIKIFAFCPRQSEWTLTGTSNTFTVLDDQSAASGYADAALTTPSGYLLSDLMTGQANDGKSVARTGAAVPVKFRHVLSKVTVNLVQGTGLDINTVNGVYIMNTKVKGAVTMLNNQISGVAPATGSLSPEIHIGTNKNSCSGIIIPQTVTGSTQFIKVTTSDGGTYIWPMAAAGQTFAGGYEYKYTITLNLYSLSVTSTVEPWSAGNGNSGETGTIKHV